MRSTSLLLSFFICALGFMFFSCGGSNQQEQSATATDTTMTIAKTTFGTLPDGQTADHYTLRNKNGMEVKITNYGGLITHWMTPDKNGAFDDVVLGYDTLGGYLKSSPFFGALVGRYGNRIANAKFTLDGKTYTLAANNGPNSLHGGLKGFDKVLWKTEVLDNENAIKLTYVSKDGEEGFPGALSSEVIYRLTDDNALEIEYTATTDKPTVVNLTNHSYFNLSGGKSDILGHEVSINADNFIPVDKTLIPVGEIRSVKGTPFDFTNSTAIGARIDDPKDEQIKLGGGYDHCWVVNGSMDSLRLAATAYEPVSGRFMEVFTTEPGVQFYTGNFLNGGITGKKGVVYKKRSGFCFETEHYPDSPNQASFPSVVLRPGETYKTKTVYKFSAK
jgi:aldose 1-epimerase